MAGDKTGQTNIQQNIDLEKGLDPDQKGIIKPETNRYIKQQLKMQEIFMQLNGERFDVKCTYDSLKEYIKDYSRILYSTVSNLVYDIEENAEENKQDPFATLLSNLDFLRDYANNNEETSEQKGNSDERKLTSETKKAVWKLWDHINLAHRQFHVLRLSEGDYKKRFEEHIRTVQSDMTKETNSQLLTIVGIFTALAFVVFGGISSFGSILTGIHESQLLKLLIVACVWGIGMLNVVFIFLFGIGKMTGKELRSGNSKRIRERYPVYFWANYVIISLLLLFGWLYYCHNRQSFSWLDWMINRNPALIGFIGCAVIVIMIIFIAKLLRKNQWPFQD